MIDLKKIHKCGNCNYYEDFSGVCCNGASDFVADFTDEDFHCDKWEEKKGDKNEV